MLDWPSASVILGTLATVATAILKWAPKNTGNGLHFAKATDMATVMAKLGDIERRIGNVEGLLRDK